MFSVYFGIFSVIVISLPPQHPCGPNVHVPSGIWTTTHPSTVGIFRAISVTVGQVSLFWCLTVERIYEFAFWSLFRYVRGGGAEYCIFRIVFVLRSTRVRPPPKVPQIHPPPPLPSRSGNSGGIPVRTSTPQSGDQFFSHVTHGREPSAMGNGSELGARCQPTSISERSFVHQ